MMHTENQRKAKSILDKLVGYNNDEQSAVDFLMEEIERVRYEERSASHTLVTSIRSVYVRNLLPKWDEVGHSDRLMGYLEVEKKLKAYKENSYNRLITGNTTHGSKSTI